MFKKYPEEKPSEDQRVIAIHNEEACATQFSKFNVRVPEEELPKGLIHGIRKSDECWFMDVQIKPEDLKNLKAKDVWWAPFPDEAVLPKKEAEEIPEPQS